MKIKKYILPIMLITAVSALSGCAENKPQEEDNAPQQLVFSESAELMYAKQFSIDRYEGGYSLISTADGGKYLIVPQEAEVPEDLDADTKIIRQSCGNIYLAATSVMGLFDALDECGQIRFSGTKAENWYIPSAREAMEKGDILYAGKYREPDYELLVSEDCRLSIQSTMINHTPEVKEKLEELGITVFTDLSSYEEHPLGRSEWIKVYGEMTGQQEKAEKLFNEQVSYLDSGDAFESTGKTAVYFYVSDSGQIVTRKSGDYVTKMIELAGGENVFYDLGSGSASSSVTMEPEKFYETAKDADFIIYNSTISGSLSSLDELIEKYPLLTDFKAVQNGSVWCTSDNLFQETMKLGVIIHDMNSVFTGNTDSDPPEFLYHLESGDAVE